jgi:hypothetical protein
MIRYSNVLHGISLYIDRNVTITDTMIEQGKQVAYLLRIEIIYSYHSIYLFVLARIAFQQ